MAADAIPAFEVATIKPSKPEHRAEVSAKWPPFFHVNTSLSALITFAYGVHPRQIMGGPAWMESEKYDWRGSPMAKASPATSSGETCSEAAGGSFRAHLPSRQKGALRLCDRRRKNWPKAYEERRRSERPSRPVIQGARRDARQERHHGGLRRCYAAAVLDRPVVDQTGLSGRFDFQLTWTPDETQFGGLGVKLPAPGR